MKKQFEMLLSIALVFIILSSLPVQAIVLDYIGDGEYSISGDLDNPRAGKLVTLKVADSDGDIIFARQLETESDGVYKFLFELTQNGDVIATVSEDGILKDSISFYKPTDDEIVRVIALLNEDSSISSIAASAESNPYGQDAAVFKVFQLSLTEFKTYNSSGLFAKVIDDMQYSSSGEFMNNYNVAKFLVECEKTTSDSELLSLMKSYNTSYDNTVKMQYGNYLQHKNKKIASVYDAYTDTQKLKILKSLYGRSFDSLKIFYDTLYDNVITGELNAIHNYNEKYAYAEKYNDTLTLDLSKYQGLGDYYDEFKQEAFSQSILNIEDLKLKCEAAYTKYLLNPPANNNNNTNNNKGSQSSISVGGMGSGVVPSVPVQPIVMFSDIADYLWAQEAITELAKKGVISGKAEKTYAPADNITRAEFAKILIGALNITSDGTQSDFSDVPQSHWAYKYVSTAEALGIVNGIDDDYFGADITISRQDMAAMCYRALNILNAGLDITDKKEFADNSAISDYALEAVSVMGGAGIINGRGDNMFYPLDLLTRAEAAKIVYSLIGVI